MNKWTYVNKNELRLLFVFLYLMAGLISFPAYAADDPASTALDYDGKAVTIFSNNIAAGGKGRICVDLVNSNTSAVLDMWSCDYSKPNQKWIVERDGAIRSQVNPSKCITWTNYLSVTDCIFPTPDSQSVVFRKSGRITNKAGTRCMNIRSGSSALGTALLGYTCSLAVTPPLNEVFSTLVEPEAYLTIRSSTDATRVLDVAWAASTGSVQLYTENDHLNQLWFIERVSLNPPLYYLHSAMNGNCLDQSDTNISIRPCNAFHTPKNQQWRLARAGSDQKIFTLVNEKSGFCLKQSAGSTIVGACDLQSSDNWKFEIPANQQRDVVLVAQNPDRTFSCLAPPSENNSTLTKLNCANKNELLQAQVDIFPDKTIRFKTTGKCLDAYNSGDTAGQWDCHLTGADNQIWRIQAVGLASAFAVPLNEWISFQNASNTHYLTETFSGGGLTLQNGRNTNSQWKVEAWMEANECEGDVRNLAVDAPPPPPPNPNDRFSLSPEGVAALNEMIEILQTILAAMPNRPSLEEVMTDAQIQTWTNTFQTHLNELRTAQLVLNSGVFLYNHHLLAIMEAHQDFNHFFAEVQNGIMALFFPIIPEIQIDYYQLRDQLNRFEVLYRSLPTQSFPAGTCLGFSRNG